MIKIATVAEIQAIEAAADKAGVSYAQMMDNAGRAVADRVKQILEEFPEPRVAILVGPGNNGGDGLVAGRLIAEESNATVTFFLTQPRDESDQNFAKVKAANLLVVDAPTDAEQGYRVLRTMVANADVILDSLLGTGTKLPIKGEMEKVLRAIHQALHDRESDRPRSGFITPERPGADTTQRPVIVAVDVPTGLNADNGDLDEQVLYANETISFETAKVGHVTFDGRDAVGVLHIAPLGIADKIEARDSIQRTLIDASTVRKLLPKRPANANKGTFGKALIVAGSLNYVGAAALAGFGAYRVGAGLVTLAVPQPLVGMLAPQIPEATWILLPHDMGVISDHATSVLRKEMGSYTAMLIGPGLGQEDVTKEFIETLFVQQKKASRTTRRIGFSTTLVAEVEAEPTTETPLPPLVVDADALNLLAKLDEWWTRLPANSIITPHPGEMARLAKIESDVDKSPAQVVQSDRLGLAAESAAKWNCIVVLKGAHTVIAHPDGRMAVMPFANAALARAGTGDVLAGAIVGYLAQGLSPFDAAVAAAYVHAYAGELAANFVGSKASVLASDIVATLADSIGAIESVE
jgi:hydroxyethylthiazole kinase-like uncharacterized protein yjeF